jgi:hypothetical protein
VRRALLGLAVLISALIAAGCGPDLTSTPSADSPVEGVVISVDAASLTDIRGFTIRTSAGQTLAFKLGDLENATQFSPSHLKEHQATSVPIRVWFQVVNGDRVAYRLEDASASPAPTT